MIKTEILYKHIKNINFNIIKFIFLEKILENYKNIYKKNLIIKMLKCKNVFWFENLAEIFCDFRIIPYKNMNLELQLNALTRLVFFIFILLLLFIDLKNSLLFLTSSLIIIIIFYYIKKNSLKEMFTPNIKNKTQNNDKYLSYSNSTYSKCNQPFNSYIDKSTGNFDNTSMFDESVTPAHLLKFKRPNKDFTITKEQTLQLNSPDNYVFCNDEVPFDFNNISDYSDYNAKNIAKIDNVTSGNIGDVNNMYNKNDNNSTYQSLNNKLSGPPNPKSLIPPIITPPIAALDYWKTNNLITHSHINDQKQIDDYQSGYRISTPCGSYTKNEYLQDNFPKLLRDPIKPKRNGYKKNNYQKNKLDLNDYTETKETFKLQKKNKENFIIEDVETIKMPFIINPKPNQSGQVNVSCGYNPEQLFDSNLPTNYPAGNCEKDHSLRNFNQNLFTQTIQPGVYTYNEIDEPINSNMGISFTQQFEPTTVELNENEDSITYNLHDPRLFSEEIEPYVETVNESNVYDPRFTGYGTSYRSYTDDKIGQTRFYYDDIDSVRMPNYICRSNIDFMKAADTYGPMRTETGDEYTSQIRNLANDQFLQSSLTFRTGLQQSLMRKINSEKWQQRKMPINTNGQRSMGGRKI